MNQTKIEWIFNPDGTRPGWSWNPITGCLNGCEYCYARKLANGRLKGRYLANSILPSHNEPNHEVHHADPFYPRFWEGKLAELPRSDGWSFIPCQSRNKILGALKRGARGVFTCDMSDLFGIGVPEEWTGKVLEAVSQDTIDRFYLLTKQPQNLAKWSPFPGNCWVGVSATTLKEYDAALKGLLDVIAKVKFLSFEPLLEEVINNDRDHGFCNLLAYCRIGWVIIGACTGSWRDLVAMSAKYPALTAMARSKGSRWTLQPPISWVQEIVEAADKAGVKVFLKNNLEPLLNAPIKDALFWRICEDKLRQEMPLP